MRPLTVVCYQGCFADGAWPVDLVIVVGEPQHRRRKDHAGDLGTPGQAQNRAAEDGVLK